MQTSNKSKAPVYSARPWSCLAFSLLRFSSSRENLSLLKSYSAATVCLCLILWGAENLEPHVISQDWYGSVFFFWAILVYSEKTVAIALHEDFFQNLLKRITCRINDLIIIMLLLTNYIIKHILGIMFKRTGCKCDPHTTRIIWIPMKQQKMLETNTQK